MADEFLGDRKKALEESFFAKENAKLVERLRTRKLAEQAEQSLMQASGIRDTEILRKLVELGIEADTWAAISLVPLIEVAWADGNIDPKERRAVLSAAEASGLLPGTPGYELLESWLAHRPDGRLIETWGEYIVALCANLGEAERHALAQEVLGRARSVAESAGGILGMGNKVSPEEEVMLSELKKAFES